MISAVAPQEIRAANHKTKNKKKWSSKEWKIKREEFIISHGSFCDWCGSDSYLTVHHPYRNVYGKTTYDDFYLSECVLLCRSCHSATHAGMVLCTYKEGIYHDGARHYRFHDAEKCSFCFKKEHPEVEIARKLAKNQREKRARDARKKQAERAKQWKKDHPIDVKVKK
jgi:hypothetical protein